MAWSWGVINEVERGMNNNIANDTTEGRSVGRKRSLKAHQDVGVGDRQSPVVDGRRIESVSREKEGRIRSLARLRVAVFQSVTTRNHEAPLGLRNRFSLELTSQGPNMSSGYLT